MKKRIVYGVVLLLISLLFAGCGKPSEPAQTAPSSNTQTETADDSADKTSAVTEKLGAKLSATYADMMKDKQYLMKYKMTSTIEGKSMEIEATIAVSGDNTAAVTVAEGMKTTFLSKGEKTYLINHSEKMVMELPQGSAMETEQSNEIETDGLTYESSGSEDGLTYEKYRTDDGTLKYYFDGDKLVKIAVEIEGQTLVMNILEMSSKVPDSMFEIPADYQKTQMPG